MTAEDYKGQPVSIRQGRDFYPMPSIGYQSIECLRFLYGRPWNDLALGFVQGLRPSRLRVCTDGIQLDMQPWRVTVMVNGRGLIESIEQEVQVGLPDGVQHGQDLMDKAMSQ
jgi:hypothetical protein